MQQFQAKVMYAVVLNKLQGDPYYSRKVVNLEYVTVYVAARPSPTYNIRPTSKSQFQFVLSLLSVRRNEQESAIWWHSDLGGITGNDSPQGRRVGLYAGLWMASAVPCLRLVQLLDEALFNQIMPYVLTRQAENTLREHHLKYIFT